MWQSTITMRSADYANAETEEACAVAVNTTAHAISEPVLEAQVYPVVHAFVRQRSRWYCIVGH